MFTVTVLLALVGFVGVAYAAYGSTCSADDACIDTDNTVCVTMSGCDSGTCIGCKTGYIVAGGACKKGHGEACTADDECAHGKCSTTCGCDTATQSYDSANEVCYTTAKGKFGDTCDKNNVDTDCEVGATANGKCTGTAGSEVCGCKDGYKEAVASLALVCRKLYLGETGCDSTAGCGMKGTVEGTHGEEAATCSGSGATKTCTCSNAEVTYGGTSYCSPDPPTKTKANQQDCTAHNECKSGMCLQCGGASNAVCVPASNSSSRIAIQSTVLLVLAIVVGLLQL